MNRGKKVQNTNMKFYRSNSIKHRICEGSTTCMSNTDLNILYYRDPAFKMKAQSMIHINRTASKRLSQDSNNLGFTVVENNSKIIRIIRLKMLQWPQE
jgi:hypothetical protein